MHGWLNQSGGWMNEWVKLMNECMYERINEWMDKYRISINNSEWTTENKRIGFQ